MSQLQKIQLKGFDFVLDSRFRGNDRKEIPVSHTFRVVVIPDLIGNPETLRGNDKRVKLII